MNLGHVIEYFNENFKKANFEDINTCKYMYIEFTKFLINRINVGIANARGYQLQHSCKNTHLTLAKLVFLSWKK